MSKIMRAAPGLFALFALIAVTAAMTLGPIRWPQLLASREVPAEKPAGDKAAPRSESNSTPEPKAEAVAPDAASAPSDKEPPSFDIVRINPDGTSVFAGRAGPNETVTVLADGKPVGSVTADSNGEWSLATEDRLPSRDPVLSLSTDPQVAARAAAAKAEAQKVASASGVAVGAAPGSVKAVTQGMLKDLEGLVEEARKNPGAAETKTAPEAGSGSPAVVADAGPSSGLSAGEGTPVATSPGGSAPGVAAASEVKRVPVPIMFVYREATFTSEGERAAALLLEYLKLKSFRAVTLTGHADERGTAELNMDLSRERLNTVARYLEEGGFKGKLDLVPKGKGEPFTGVDRSRYALEDLYQLDRRVELRVSQ